MTSGIEEEPAELTPRQQRRVNVMIGAYVLIFTLFAGVPVVVGLSYHIFGWQIAVLLLPVLYTLTFRAIPVPKKRRNGLAAIRRWISRAIVFGIPIISVWFSEPNYMRAWAVAVGGGMFAIISADKPVAISVTRNWIVGSDLKRQIVYSGISLSGAVLFVVLSELIWHFFPLGLWIWFHAFAFVIFLTLWVSMIALISRSVSGEVLGNREPENRFKKGRRPSIRSSKDAERYSVSHHQADGSIIQYKDVSPEQAKWLFARVDWDDEAQLAGDPGSNSEPDTKFKIDFEGSFVLTLRPDSPELVRVDWFYHRPRRSWQIWGERISFVAVRVPADQADAVIDLAWSEKWDEIEVLLSDYIDEQFTPRS